MRDASGVDALIGSATVECRQPAIDGDEQTPSALPLQAIGLFVDLRNR